MEPDVRLFLINIVQSLSMGLLWLLVNMTAGIYYKLGFFDNFPAWYNYLFYVWLIASFGLLLWYLRRKWKDFKEITDQ